MVGHFCLGIPIQLTSFSQRDIVESHSGHDLLHSELLQRIHTLFLHTKLMPELLAVHHAHTKIENT